MLKKALMPLSLKERFQRVKDMASYIRYFGTEKVYLCHVDEGNSRRKTEKINKTLQQYSESIKETGLDPEIIVEKGPVAEVVCGLARKLEVDYIAIKWRRKNVIKRTILTSPDTDMLRICNYPIFIYKTKNYLDPQRHIHNVIYATDFKDSDDKVVPYVRAASQGAENLYILHVRERAPDPVTDKQRHEEVMEKLKWLSKQYRDCYHCVEPVVATGTIRSQIARKVRGLNADLIIIGKKDTQKPIDKLIGSTAEAVPYKVHSSIMIIP